MASYLRHVRESSHAEPVELASQRLCHSLGYRGLAHPRGTRQTQDLSLDGSAELAHSDELEDDVFDVVQSVVLSVQDLTGPGQVVAFGGGGVPGKFGEPVQVGTGDVELSAVFFQSGEFFQFCFDGTAGFLGNFGKGGQFLSVFSQQSVFVVLLHAQFLLDTLELFGEEVAALGFGHLGLDLGGDFLLETGHFAFFGEEGQGFVEARFGVLFRQDALQLSRAARGHAGCEICQFHRIVGVHPRRKVMYMLPKERIERGHLPYHAHDLVAERPHHVALKRIRHDAVPVLHRHVHRRPQPVHRGQRHPPVSQEQHRRLSFGHVVGHVVLGVGVRVGAESGGELVGGPVRAGVGAPLNAVDLGEGAHRVELVGVGEDLGGDDGGFVGAVVGVVAVFAEEDAHVGDVAAGAGSGQGVDGGLVRQLCVPFRKRRSVAASRSHIDGITSRKSGRSHLR
mmetsp:Transcript_31669/g.72628  ORF Transcript_31669/g.72628 Transcript_31669/m.72628 type:complete len:452 (-) Transcript_31669:766-2121(-)